jgi:hypothetical protein
MTTQAKIWSVLLTIVLVSSFAVALQDPVPQQAGTSNQVVVGAQDVITASDSGGGSLSTSDIILIVILVLAIIGLAAIL